MSSNRYIINTISDPTLDSKFEHIINEIRNFKDTAIDLPGVNTSDENAMRMAFANAYNSLLAQGEFSKAAQIGNLAGGQIDSVRIEDKK